MVLKYKKQIAVVVLFIIATVFIFVLLQKLKNTKTKYIPVVSRRDMILKQKLDSSNMIVKDLEQQINAINVDVAKKEKTISILIPYYNEKRRNINNLSLDSSISLLSRNLLEEFKEDKLSK